jgi:hypothetical protein
VTDQDCAAVVDVNAFPDTWAGLESAVTFNWVDKAGGLPKFIKRIKNHLVKKGMDTSRAIATAVNVVKKMCASGDTNWPGKQNVNAGSRAEACGAVADWERKKAQSHAD